jgi:amino acid transporter
LAELTRTLSLTEAIGLSLSIVAPTLTAAFNISLAVQKTGPAAPLAFAGGTLMMVLVAAAFVSFARRGAHAGSVYAYIAEAFGRRAGFVAGWTLLLTYLTFTSAMGMLVGDFVGAALKTCGVASGWLWLVIGEAAIGLAVLLASRNVRLAGRLMLTLELASVAAIAVLCLIILQRTAPLPAANQIPAKAFGGFPGFGYALVFAVLSFAGFEGAATLGEETHHPRRNIPIAIMGAVALSGAFFIFAAYCEVRGFGLTRIGELARSSAPLDDLALRFTSKPFAVVLDIAAAVSAFAGCLGSLTAAARLLFALGRAGLSPRLARVHERHGTPWTAAAVGGGVAALGALAWAPSSGPGDYYARLSTVGTLALMLVYLGVVAAQCRRGLATRAWIGPLVGAAAAAALVWCLAATVYPVPSYPDSLWPYVVAAWIALALPILWMRPSVGRRSSFV